MSITALLTTTQLRSLADLGYERGVRYWRDGRVLSCERNGESIVGIVAGQEQYQVRLFAHGRQLYWECECPVDHQMCKHAVALAMHYLESSGAPDAQRGSSPVITTGGPVFAAAAEMREWAIAHHVEYMLGESALVLLPDLVTAYKNESVIHFTLSRLVLRETGPLEVVQRFVSVPALRRPAAEATRRWLERAAEDVVTGVAEETTERSPVADPLLAKFAEKLVATRRDIRRDAYPRSRATRARGTLVFDPKVVRLRWDEPTKMQVLKQSFALGAVSTTLALVPSAHATCTCGKPCTHVLALIDAALDLIADPAREEEAKRIAAELLRPAWQRALDAFAALEERATKPPTEIEVTWRFEPGFGGNALAPIVRRQLKRGGMSAGARSNPERLLLEFRASLSEQDLRVAELLAGWEEVPRSSTYPSRAFLALAGHPRVVAEETPDQRLAVKRFALGFTAVSVGERIRIEPAIDGARFSPRLLTSLLQLHPAGEPLLVYEPEHDRCLLVDVADEARELWTTLERHGDEFPPESHEKLLEQLARFERRLPVSVPQELRGTRHAEDMTVVMRLRLIPSATGDVALELEAFVRPAPGAQLYPPTAGPRDVSVIRDRERGYVRREISTELERVRGALARLPLEHAEQGPPLCFQITDPDHALELVAAIQKPPPGIEAEWIDRRQTVISASAPSSLRIKVDRKRDWFGIEGELLADRGRLELAVLLDAVRRQRRFVRLDDDRWIELSDLLRQRLVAIADQTHATRNQLELSPGAVPAIKAIGDAGAKVETAPAWQLLTERLAGSVRLRPKPPATLEATLRPYQIEGHAWLSRVAAWGAGACLADDMGLGKTVQAIAVLLDRAKLGPALVLSPTSVTFNWADELKRFAPSLRPVIYGDENDRAKTLAALGKKDVLIASYGLLARDIEQLAALEFGTLVVDEAQALKNPATQRVKAARQLNAQFRIALTGTPLENNVGELWSLFSIVFPGLLGSLEQFRQRFALPIERDRDPEARAALSRVIRPFLLRRAKSEVATELPARTEIAVPVALSTAEQTLYEDARLAAVAELSRQAKGTRDERQRFQVLAALTRLRLLASHPRLYDSESEVTSSKMQRLLELVEELRSEGHRALVFSQFTSHLELVRAELARAGFSTLYLDGGTPAATRAKLIAAFQAGEGDAFLISLKAGGTGINLTAADYVIHLDPWWNPAVEDQATDRAHRIGQDKPVTVYRLISRGTVEERILAMHHDKRALVSSVLEGTDVAGRLTTRDLLALLAGGDDVHAAAP